MSDTEFDPRGRYNPAADPHADRTRGLWGGPPAEPDEDDSAETPEDDVEAADYSDGTELELHATYLDDEQLARVEALGHARAAMLVSGFLGNTPKLTAVELAYLAEWILKGSTEDADETDGTDAASTDAEDDAPTDGGRAEPVDLRGFEDMGA